LGTDGACIRLENAKRPRNFRKMSKNATQYATGKKGVFTKKLNFAEENEGCRSKNATLENESGCIRFLILLTKNGGHENINSIIHLVVK
jgi:hypothetical protein